MFSDLDYLLISHQLKLLVYQFLSAVTRLHYVTYDVVEIHFLNMVHHVVAVLLQLSVCVVLAFLSYSFSRILVVMVKILWSFLVYFGTWCGIPIKWSYNYGLSWWNRETLGDEVKLQYAYQRRFDAMHHTVEKEGAKFLVETETGRVLHQVFDSLPLQTSSGSTTVISSPVEKEMALPTSLVELFDKSRLDDTSAPGVCSLRSGDGSLISMASRTSYKGTDVLLTAAHSWASTMRCAEPKLEAYGKLHRIDKSWLIVAYSPAEDLDFVAVSIPSYVWANLGVTTLKWANVRHGSNAKIYGYGPQGFSFSRGTLELCNIYGTIKHNASSTHGWSGSPVIVNGRIVGVHTGADRNEKKNIAHYIPQTFREDSEDLWLETQFKRVDELPVEPVGTVSMWDLDGSHDYDYSKKHVTVYTKAPPIKFKGKAWADMDEDDHFAFFNDHQESASFQDFLRDNEKAASSRSNLGLMMSSLSPRVLASATSASIPVLRHSPRRRRNRSSSIELHSNFPFCSTMDGQASEGLPSIPLSSSKSRDTSVLVLVLSRRQEKIYNAICHTRAFQRALRESEYPLILRRKALDFATSSSNASTASLVQAFLGTL
nr:MAG: hypothetical protein [Barnaviridae sp.]